MRLARLQAVLSKNKYSEHGLDALICPPAGDVCHSLIVVLNCTPGSAHLHAASAILLHKSLALTVFIVDPSVLAVSSQSPSDSKALINSFGTLTELLEFCPETVAYASPL